MERFDSMEFAEAMTVAKRWASVALWISSGISLTAFAAMLFLPDMAPTAGSALLAGLIFASLSAAVAGWEATATGYILLLIAFLLQNVAPYILPGLMGSEAAGKILKSFAEAAGMPMVIGILMAIKDLVTRLILGLSLKRVQMETPTVMYAASLVDEEEGDAMRQYHKYRMLVVPTLVASIAVYLMLLGPIREAIVDTLKQVDTAVVQTVPGMGTPKGPSVQSGGMVGTVNAPVAPGIDRQTQKMISQASSQLAEPAFVNVLLVALGIMFVTQFLGILEWAIYKKQW